MLPSGKRYPCPLTTVATSSRPLTSVPLKIQSGSTVPATSTTKKPGWNQRTEPYVKRTWLSLSLNCGEPPVGHSAGKGVGVVVSGTGEGAPDVDPSRIVGVGVAVAGDEVGGVRGVPAISAAAPYRRVNWQPARTRVSSRDDRVTDTGRLPHFSSERRRGRSSCHCHPCHRRAMSSKAARSLGVGQKAHKRPPLLPR